MKTSLLWIAGIISCISLQLLRAQPSATEPQRIPTVANPHAVTATPLPAANGTAKKARLSAGLDDIVKLVHAKVDDSLILSFVKNSRISYHPTADEIIKLREMGVSSPVITALLQRGEEVRARAIAMAQKPAQTASKAPAAQAPAPAQATGPTTYAQQPVNASAASTYTYSYPASSPSVIYASAPYRYTSAGLVYRDYGYSGSYYPGYCGYGYGYGGCYYPGSYSYPSFNYCGGFYPGISLGFRFGGGHGFVAPSFHYGGGFRGGGFHGGVHHAGFRGGGRFHR